MTDKKIGLEKEVFLLDEKGIPQIVPSEIPMDESGILAEARGNPFFDGVEAVYSLMASIHGLEQAIAVYNKRTGRNLHISDTPLMKISRKTRIELSRLYTKPRSEYQNLYGFDSHRNTQSEQTAGIHISFTYPTTINTRNNTQTTVNQLFDFPQLIRKLDNTFKTEIREAKRRQGFYEIKSDGRIEYRSLPSNTPLEKIMAFFEKESMSESQSVQDTDTDEDMDDDEA